MAVSWELVIAGTLVGLAAGLTGMGGGALLTPILVLMFGLPPTVAVGSDLLASAVMKPIGAAVHQRAGTVRWELVRWLAPTAVPTAFAGPFLLHLFGSGALLQQRVKLAVGAALLTAVCGMVVRTALNQGRAVNVRPAMRSATQRVRPILTLLIGLIGGLMVGMTSVGSGSVIMVLLMFAYPRLRANDLIGTDLVQAVPLVGAGALGHLIAGNVQLAVTAWLLVGAIPGVYVGARISIRAPSDLLKWVLAVLLLGTGLRLWHVSTIITIVLCAGVGTAALGHGIYMRQLRSGN